MVHEAMVLEYSGRHLAVIELAASLKLLLYVSLIACVFVPWGLAPAGAGLAALAIGVAAYVGKLAVGGFLLALFETSIAKMRVFRVPDFLGVALMLGLLATLLLFVSREPVMHGLDLRHRPSAGRRPGAGELHAALPGPALRAAQRLRAARAGAGAVGRLAGLHPGRAASLRHRRDRARLQGDRHPGRAAPDHRAPRHPSRDREGGRHRPDHARRHRPGRAVDGGHAARDRRTPIRWRARISPSRCRWCCSAC